MIEPGCEHLAHHWYVCNDMHFTVSDKAVFVGIVYMAFCLMFTMVKFSLDSDTNQDARIRDAASFTLLLPWMMFRGLSTMIEKKIQWTRSLRLVRILSFQK